MRFLPACLLALIVVLAAAESPADNAAFSYFEAFALLPDDATDREVRDALKDYAWNDAIPPASNQYFRDWHRGSLMALRRADAATACDWGFQPSDVCNGTVKRCTAMAQELAKLGLARATYRFANNDRNGALADILAVFRLSRHIGQVRSILAVIARLDIESLAIKIFALHCQRLDEAAVGAFMDELEKLPSAAAIVDVVRDGDGFRAFEMDLLARSEAARQKKYIETSLTWDESFLTKARREEILARFAADSGVLSQWIDERKTNAARLAEFMAAEHSSQDIVQRLHEIAAQTANPFVFDEAASLKYVITHQEAQNTAYWDALEAGIALRAGPKQLPADAADRMGIGPWKLLRVLDSYTITSTKNCPTEPIRLKFDNGPGK